MRGYRVVEKDARVKPERIYIEERGDGTLQVIAKYRTHETVLGECPAAMKDWLESLLPAWRPASDTTGCSQWFKPVEAVR